MKYQVVLAERDNKTFKKSLHTSQQVPPQEEGEAGIMKSAMVFLDRTGNKIDLRKIL